MFSRRSLFAALGLALPMAAATAEAATRRTPAAGRKSAAKAKAKPRRQRNDPAAKPKA